ncbi:hypothetical protein TNCV_2811721 [Trichonephila clavipes]|nr:hypothetical protein TNCV_2811721 [Trichonephila clavipes]
MPNSQENTQVFFHSQGLAVLCNRNSGFTQSQPAYFALANVFYHDGKPMPIELSIATIPRDGGDPEVICITVNHAGQTSKPKDFRSNCQDNARLHLVHPRYPRVCPWNTYPLA